MARLTESSLSSEKKATVAIATEVNGNSLPEASLTEESPKSQSTLASKSSCRVRKPGKGRGSSLAALNKKTPFRATVKSSVSSKSSKQSLVANPTLPSASISGSSDSPPSQVTTTTVNGDSPTAKNVLNGPTFAQIATRPIRIAKLIMSKITVELTGEEFYLVKDDQNKPFFLDKETIESKYSQLLRLYRASIRGKLIC